METRGLLVRGSSPFVLPNSIAQCQQQQDGRSLSIPSTSLEREWSFRVQRTKLTSLSGRRNISVNVRAKESAGSSKGKTKESEAEEDDDQPAAQSKALYKVPGRQRPLSRAVNRSKDNNTVFVAGATGKVGRRTVKELVKLGYNVRAGVRNPDKAQFLLGQEDENEESVEEEQEEQPKKKGLFGGFSIEKLFGFLGTKNKREGRVDLVQCDLEKSVEDIEEALGNAGVVICAIGASEKEVLDVTGPYRIDYKATKNLIDAASSANANHFILVTSLGTKKFGWPAAVLNLFWGVLVWKAKAEDALVASGIPFTIVRPGGMERPTDAYKETHNLRLSEADTLFGGQVSNLQVAELMAAVVGNLDLARNKILEAVAETTAPLRPFDELLAEVPSVDGESEPVKSRSQVTRVTSQIANQLKEEDRGTAVKRQAAERERTEAIRQRLQEQYEAARLKEEEARREAEAARAQKAEIEKRTADLRSKLQAAEQSAREAKALETALIAAARQGKNLSEREKQDIIASVRAEVQAEQKAKESKQKALQAPKEKPKVEAPVQPPTKSKAEVAAENRAKQDAERKAREKEEADLRAKEEAEAKAKADAEAAEAEKKRVQAELKAKEEEEVRKKEEEEKRVEAERKAKEEEEKRIEAEKKANQEEEKEEERLRIEAEKKAQEEQDDQATAKTSPKGFRWPWQQEQPEKEAEEEEAAAAPAASSSTVEEKAAAEQPEPQELPRPSRPLSPYIQFPSLKPPSPPSPPAPTATKVEEDVSAKGETTVSEEPVPVKEEEEVAPEESILEKKEETPEVIAEDSPKDESKEPSANFSWQQPDREEDSPKDGATTAAETVVEDTASVNQTISQEEGSERNTEELPRPPRPLSPFAAYPALKPPTPPVPPKTSKSGRDESQPEALGVAEVTSPAPVESSNSAPGAETQKTRPLSPFILYPGLKPPQPPSPPVAAVAENPEAGESSNIEEASVVVGTAVTI